MEHDTQKIAQICNSDLVGYDITKGRRTLADFLSADKKSWPIKNLHLSATVR